jgi:Spy/CpxP family protein refolding chaperone
MGAALAGVVGAVLAGCGRGSHSHGWHHNGHGRHEVHSPEEAQERARKVAAWVLREVDATEAQEQRIQAIVEESVEQMLPLRERHQQHHQALIEALSQGSIDRAEIERLRKAELEIADAASNWLADAALDALEVLTPKQREQLMEHVRERHL